MKKKYWYYIAATILLLLLIFLGYYFFLKKKSYRTGIPQNTELLFKIDTYKTVKDFGSKIKKLKVDSALSRGLIKSIKLPATIFVYTIKGKKASTFFTSLEISNHKTFEETIAKKFKQEPLANNTLKKFVSNNGLITIIFNNKQAVFSYALIKDEVDNILISILEKKNLIPVSESSFKEILNRKEAIVFYNKTNEGFLWLEHNILKGKMIIEQGEIEVPIEIVTPKFNSNNIVSFWTQASITSLFPEKEYTVDKFKISSDSIKAYFLNEVQLEISESVIQKDSIITYDYNDDFEKEEIIEIIETKIPGFVLRTKEEGNKLYAYLQKQGIIKDNKVDRKAFPLYELKVKETGNNLLFTTLTNPVLSPLEKSQNFFYLKADIKKMKKQEEFSPLFKNNYLKIVEEVEVRGYKAEEKGKIIIELSALLAE